MMNGKRYKVAGHRFDVEFPDSFSSDKSFVPYRPFEDVETGDGEPVFTLRLTFTDTLPMAEAGRFVRCFHEEAPFLWLYRRLESYTFGFSHTTDAPDCLLFLSEDYRKGTVYVLQDAAETDVSFALDNSLMLLYTLNTATRDTLLIHASVIRNGERAYVFLGKSGTGKSTHSRLWLAHIPGSYLLNDDNPVLRIENGEVYVYGSPWSGKTPCYRDERARLGAIVRLEQARQNRISRLNKLQAYASLLPSCSMMRWNRGMADGVHRTVEQIVRKDRNYLLACLPDKEAALLCAHTVKTA